MGQQILVTGGCGYIGSHVVRQLSELGHTVLVYDNLSTGTTKALIHNEQLFVSDLSESEKLAEVFRNHKVDCVFHLAASISASESVNNPEKYYQNNFINTQKLLLEMLKAGVRKIVFSSTAAVYGDQQAQNISESSMLNPSSPYARSKIACERLINDLSKRHGLQFVNFRFFNVAGADVKLRMGPYNDSAHHLIKEILRVVFKLKEKLLVFGNDYPTPDGTCVRDYVHVEDLASAHIAALNYLNQKGASTTLNCGYGHGYSIFDIISKFEEIVGSPVLWERAPKRSEDVARAVADVRKIKETLNWHPQYDDLKTILLSAYHWEKKLLSSK